MENRLFPEEKDWAATIRWCGLALFLAGILLIPFVAIVLATGQVLPVPAQQALEAPTIPRNAFLVATVGEIFLLPGFFALYLALSRTARVPMVFVLAFMAISSPLFVASRMHLFAATKLGGLYAAAGPEAQDIWLATAELAIESQNMNSTAALLLLCAASILTGIVMLRGGFPKWIGGLAVTAGGLTVFSPFAVMLGVPVIVPFIGLVLGAVWQMAAGWTLFRQPG